MPPKTRTKTSGPTKPDPNTTKSVKYIQLNSFTNDQSKVQLAIKVKSFQVHGIKYVYSKWISIVFGTSMHEYELVYRKYLHCFFFSEEDIILPKKN